MSDDQELAKLHARIDELAAQLAEREAADQIREVEFRSLMQDVALKAAYIDRLERAQEEVVAPKDVHIRNLEAMIAQLTGNTQEPGTQEGQEPTTRPGGRLARRLRGSR